ncbi:MAG TPA: BamA/TamA family outer membrane protein [Capillibacterium sp.]
MGKTRIAVAIQFLLVLLFLVVPAGVKAQDAAGSEYEEYRSQLEMEYFIPFIYYDGTFTAATYAQMSSILRDQELKFVMLGSEDELLNLVLSYTYHAPFWSYGLNLYHMPVYTSSPWGVGFWERQLGVSFLASRHYSNQTRLDLRVQYEDFAPESDFRYPVDAASIFGLEATLTHDDFVFLTQTGSRGYLSVGGALPLLGTAYQNLKVEGDYRKYWSRGRASLILAGRSGKIWGTYPAHRGFALGGIQQVSISSLGTLTNLGFLGTLADTVLRGYPYYHLRGDGFFLSNVELRMLIWPASYQQLRKIGLSLVAFTDAAWVWEGNRRVSAAPTMGAGIGLRFYLAGLNIGLDYAIPLKAGEPKPRWHFSLGEVF